MAPNIQVFPDQTSLSQAAANLFVSLANEAVARNGRFLTALSGGGTPQALFQQLSQPPYNSQVPWKKNHFFWGDERLVPPDDPGSNYGQARQILLDHVPVPAANIHRVKGELDSVSAVGDYKNQLQQLSAPSQRWPRFDLALMGMGGDGHTASLFPGPISPVELKEPVFGVTALYEDRPAHRLTLTPLVFNNARLVLFLVTGAKKAAALQAVLYGPKDLEKLPAQRIQPTNGELIWFVDETAAAQLSPTPLPK